MRFPSPSPSTGNRVIDALPPAAAALVVSQLASVPLEPPTVLFEPGRPLSTVYFPLEGVISMVVPFRDGSIVEVATIGREGIAGIPEVLGGPSPGPRLVAQVRGRALSMPAKAFVDCVLTGSAPLRTIVFRYDASLFNHVAQVAGCNRLHTNEARLARWLLQTQDRVTGDDFVITQEFLGQMLGVRRETVTISARILQAGGMIRYQRGQVRIVDRPALLAAACECYEVMRAAADNVFA